jgi:putative ABC transport system permease protein
MAIFGQSDKAEPVSKGSGATIIAECAKIVGEFNTNCSLHIDGKFEGNIKSNNVVTIGKSGYAKGNVSASNFIVSGIFEGDIDCSVVEVLPGGIIKGKIVSNEIINKAYKKDMNKFDLMVGTGLAEELMLNTPQKVTLIFTNSTAGGISLMPSMKRFHVVNEFNSGLVAYDKAFMYCNIEDLRKILKTPYNSYDGIHIHSKEPFKDIIKLKQFLSSNVAIVGWWEQNGNFFSAQQMEKQALFIVLMLIILIASLNIISSLLMTIMSRRKEIALLLSLGMSKIEIKKLFFYIGLVIGGFGMIFGIAFGFSGIWILENTNLITIPADVYGTAQLPFDLLVSDFISIIVGGIFIVLISSFYPAQKASKIDVIKTLKYE